MTKERLYLFDTTLRDGAQTTGVEFSLEDKIAISKLLDGLGLDYVEGGYPGANVVDTALFAQKRTKAAQFVAFGMTKRAGRSVENDPGIADLVNSSADAVCYVSKAWDHQVKLALGISTKPFRKRSDGHRKWQAGLCRLRALLRRLQGQPGLCARLRQDRARSRRTVGRAVRHQWRHHARRDRGDHCRCTDRSARRQAGHPCP
jgi:hypothetical protein